MKRLVLIAFAILFATRVIGQFPGWQWARSAVGIDSDQAYGVASDASGNVYITGGYISPSITFGTYTLINATTDTYTDVFIAKYDAGGNIQWARNGTGDHDDVAIDIATDASGNTYTTGYFQSPSIAFDTITLNNANGPSSSDYLIVKHDAAGNILWGQRAGGADYEEGRAVTVDAEGGNVYVTGDFSGDSLVLGSITLLNPNPGFPIPFVVKYDPDGNVIWAHNPMGNSSGYGWSISVDAGGNVYVTGDIWGTNMIFGTDTLTNDSVGTCDMFIVKYGPNGNPIWARDAGRNDVEEGWSVVTDNSGNVYVFGVFESTFISFETDTLTNAGPQDMFIVKYDSSGSVLWATSAGGNGLDGPRGIAADSAGNIYITGRLESQPSNFDTITHTGIGVFIAKYTPNGSAVWVETVNFGEGRDATVSSNGSVYIAGWFPTQTIVFGSTTLNNSGGDDVFVAKLGTALGVLESFGNREPFIVYPNPTTGKFQIQSPKTQNPRMEVQVYDLLGREVKGVRCEASAGTMEVDLSAYPSGIYFVKVGDKVEKLVLSR